MLNLVASLWDMLMLLTTFLPFLLLPFLPFSVFSSLIFPSRSFLSSYLFPSIYLLLSFPFLFLWSSFLTYLLISSIFLSCVLPLPPLSKPICCISLANVPSTVSVGGGHALPRVVKTARQATSQFILWKEIWVYSRLLWRHGPDKAYVGVLQCLRQEPLVPWLPLPDWCGANQPYNKIGSGLLVSIYTCSERPGEEAEGLD